MQIYASIISILYFNHVLVGSIESDRGYRLEQLQVLFRHGDRTPDKVEIFVNDPNDKVYQSYGYGHLTNTGKNRMYKIGRLLRRRYDAFLGEYKSNEVYAYSSGNDRTKTSLLLALAGLYPPSPSTSWKSSINWQPIPTHYESVYTGFLTATFQCPAYWKLYNETQETPEMLARFHKYRNFYQRIENNTGIALENLLAIAPVYNNLHSAVSLGLGLPSWCSKNDYRELEKIMALAFKTLTRTEQMRRMLAGPVVKQLLAVINGNDISKKIYLYCGHDLNVVPFINAHNITDTPGYGDFGSAIIIEKLRGPDDRSYIRLYLWIAVSEKLISLKLDNCERICLLSDYEKIVQPILPNKAYRICPSFKSPFRTSKRIS